MAESFGIDDLLGALNLARSFLAKHLNGLTKEQLDWKPYPECKSIREIMRHLIVDDLAAIQSLGSDKEPEYDKFQVDETEFDDLMRRLVTTRQQLEDAICTYAQGKELGDQICIYGWHFKLGVGVPYLASEDYYHAGQVAYIRMATDPAWDYYATVYGG